MASETTSPSTSPAKTPATTPPAACRLLFLFLDGVGLGAADPAVNALAAAAIPTLRDLLDGGAAVAAAAPLRATRATLLGLDATLGVEGLPQSGTGQAALLTGEDATALFGRHYGPWVPVALRPLVAERSILARARHAGRTVAFANAYPEELLAAAEERAGLLSGSRPEGVAPQAGPASSRAAAALETAGGRPPAAVLDREALSRLPGALRAGPPLAALGAGVLTRGTAALERGEAVASEIVNDGWRERLARPGVPRLGAEQAGRNLAAIAAAHDLTLFAHYATDSAGHRRELPAAIAAIERVDRFLAGLLPALPADILVVLASDHGNLEDCRAGHTRNPALFLAAGDGHAQFAQGLTRLTDVAPRVLQWLEAADRSGTGGNLTDAAAT